MAGALGNLINKKALADTPKEVFNLYVFFIAFALSFSGGLHGSNTSNISGILSMPDFIATFNLKHYSASAASDIKGWTTSVIVLGGLIGALTSSPFNDRLGRRWTLFLNALIYSVGTIVQLVATGNIKQVIGGRAMQGFASGAGTVTGTLFLAEIAPKAIRGVLGAFFSFNIMLGVSLGYWVNYIAILHISPSSHWQWRMPVLFQLYPGIILLCALPLLPESPRWLILRGKNDRALRALTRIRRLPEDHPYVQDEYKEIASSVNAEIEIAHSSSWLGLFRELKNDRTLLRRFILVMIVQIGFNFSGGNSITYYQTSILSTINVTTTDGAYLFSGIYGLMKVLAVLVYAFLLSERFGRRKMLLIGAAINILCVLWIAIYLGALAGHNKAAGWVAIAAVCLFAIGYGIGWAPVAFGLNGEVFPNRIRAKVMSLTIGMQYLANFCLTRFFPNMIANIGSFGPFAIFACVSALIWVYVFVALPETKGLSIEQMSSLFGGHWFQNGFKKADGKVPELEDVTPIEYDGVEEAEKEHSHIEKINTV
ncbi:solute carrier family 2 [Cryptococcus neoformans var. grubii Br795]|nr:solute carrier family 2 [Cryptococcus neoformans var. grubii AD1-83a]OWZ52628.1 solute carrier family 2 [Cryptococcus neoformans var. grubii 125.91]OXG47722.1 solute carrier family 2 [Cryptococcus neoformans var. grubii Th84]OXG54721.1 solute carrier family 2 [Cryptococcus neoformans var. grubii MW-RSA1955]OXG57998.1 solute carrier family 2 [Cryptococcus neoformans var. grubii CHC193]OXG61035.1 solute carrier family 2 [Cryptococcus neoformans var. grubii c8]OXG76576.1 solute carrier family